MFSKDLDNRTIKINLKVFQRKMYRFNNYRKWQ